MDTSNYSNFILKTVSNHYGRILSKAIIAIFCQDFVNGDKRIYLVDGDLNYQKEKKGDAWYYRLIEASYSLQNMGLLKFNPSDKTLEITELGKQLVKNMPVNDRDLYLSEFQKRYQDVIAAASNPSEGMKLKTVKQKNTGIF